MQSLDGFLGLEARDRGIGSHTPDGAILQRGLELNRRCHEVLVGLGPGQFTQSQLISAALFARLLEFFQGAIKCCAVGSRAAAEVLLRAELEACFTLCAVRRDPETLRIWAEQHHFFKRKLVSAIRGGWANWERAQPPGKAQEVCGVLNEHIRSTGLSQLGTLDLAKKADMEQWYQVLYRRLEGPAHSKAMDLERYFRVDADNNVFGFGPLEDFNRIGLIVSTAAEILILAVQEVEKAFDRSGDPWFESERAQFRTIAESVGPWRSTT